MKTLSNEELQLAINKSVTLYHSAHEDAQPTMLSHLQELLLEQRVRATQSVTLEPMEPAMAGPDKYHMSGGYYGGVGAAPGRVDFEARVRGRGGPEWIVCEQLDCPVDEDHDVEVLMLSGRIIRDRAGNFDWAVMGEPNAIDKYRDWTAWEQSKAPSFNPYKGVRAGGWDFTPGEGME